MKFINIALLTIFSFGGIAKAELCRSNDKILRLTTELEKKSLQFVELLEGQPRFSQVVANGEELAEESSHLYEAVLSGTHCSHIVYDFRLTKEAYRHLKKEVRKVNRFPFRFSFNVWARLRSLKATYKDLRKVIENEPFSPEPDDGEDDFDDNPDNH